MLVLNNEENMIFANGYVERKYIEHSLKINEIEYAINKLDNNKVIRDCLLRHSL